MASPLMIAIGLHYFTRAGDYGKGRGDDNFDAPATQDALRDFVDGGLLAKSPPGCEAEYYGTEALKVWFEALCDVRWPVQVWIVPKLETVYPPRV